MIVEKLSEELSNTSNEISQEHQFLELVNNLTKIQENINNHFLNIARRVGNPTDLNNATSAISIQITNGVTTAFKAIRTSSIIASAHHIKSLADNLNNNISKNISEAISLFVDSIDEWIHTKEISACIALIASANNLNQKLIQFTVAKELIEPSQGNISLPSIRIYIPGKTNLEEFSIKLLSLTEIIEICCNMLSMSMEEAAVTIEKIESGSFFAKISANPLVIALATIVVTHGSQYLFAQIQQPNKTAEIRENSDTLANLLKIRETLNENGVATDDMDDQIKSSALSLAKQLNKLVGQSQSIEVNEKTFETPDTKLITNE